jgi:F-type H+-transporting ATPase subunit b
MAPEIPSPSALDAQHGDTHDGVAVDTAHAASTEAAHGDGGGGLPQFEFQYWGGQIVWLLLLFAILYFLFSRVFVPRFRSVTETRAQTIADALSAARQVQAEADAKAEGVKAQIDKARSDARNLVVAARAKANDEMAKTQAAQDAELAAQVDRAEARIRGLRDKAMSSVRDIASDTAKAIVEKLTGKPVTAAEAKTAGGIS